MRGYEAYEETLDSGMKCIALLSPDAMVRIAPQGGMNLFSFVVRGRELMMSTQDAGAGGYMYGTPLLFPTPGRTKNSRYTWGGQVYKLMKGGKERFLHGFVVDTPFACTLGTSERGAWCEGSMELGEDERGGYPFKCRFTARITLEGSEVFFDFTVRNLGDVPQPFGVAIHPYFARNGDGSAVTLRCPAKERFVVDGDLIPSGERLQNAGDATYDLSQPRVVGELDLDTVYHGMRSGDVSRIEYRAWGLALELSADDAFENCVIYTPQDRSGFCVEPQTCVPDFLNLYVQGVEQTGMLLCAPGEAWQGRVRMAALPL